MVTAIISKGSFLAHCRMIRGKKETKEIGLQIERGLRNGTVIKL